MTTLTRAEYAGPPVRYHLPFPVSANNLFANVPGRGRFPSKRYKQWRTQAAMELSLQRARPIEGRVSVLVELCPPDKRLRDADNYLKAPIDALVRAGVIEQDDSRFVESVHAVFIASGPACQVTIRPAHKGEA